MRRDLMNTVETTHIENNSVVISGRISSTIDFSHESFGSRFYSFMLDVPRLSGSKDSIPVVISENLVEKYKLGIGTILQIDGHFRSYNQFTDEGTKLVLNVLVRSIEVLENESQIKVSNHIHLEGCICKKPIYRKTPLGREITDVLLAVNRPYNKSDYIPCITWGRCARYSANLNVGENAKVEGRIQSRSYEKKLENGEVLTKVAFEVSVSTIESIKEVIT